MANAQPVKIKTTLPDEDLLFRTMDGKEELGRPFLYDLELLSPKEDLALDDVLGQEACVALELQSGTTRYFHGYVTQFAQTGRRGRYATYRMQLRPWLWFLTRTADCRIFQGKTVPEIVAAVFREHGFSDFKDSLSASYRTWEYCVQYRETDFNFVSRLMEQEGIYYYFVHEDGKHTLVLSDSHGAHAALENGYDEIPYYPPSRAAVRDEHIYDWYFQKSVQPGKYVLRAYDFRKPKANLEVNSVVTREHAQAEYEIFDYPGEHFERGEGDAYVRTRIEELQTEYERARGVCDARGVCVGGLFNLAEYPREDQNREYLIVSAHQSISLGDYESADQPFEFRCTFNAMDSSTPYRVPRLTPKPVVQGPQTAITVGPSGEEIWTDKFGRIKVQFHWDRYGKADENSSCWVRVAQVWAGSNWGGMHIPRIGQEVIVDFIEGDPDRPIVTGRVYNADNMPPYGLPDSKTQSGIKSRSSKSGTGDNFNEIRFEDLKGSEQMYLHAEKDQATVVENDQAISVGHDKTESVGHDNTESVGNDEKIDIKANQATKVGQDQSLTVGANRSKSVTSNETIRIGANRDSSVGGNESATVANQRTHNVGINETINVGAAQEISVGAAQTVTVGAAQSVSIGAEQSTSVGGAQSLDVSGGRTIEVGEDQSTKVGGGRSADVGKDDAVKVGKTFVLDAGDSITIKTGSASITMKKDGTIVIKGKDIQLEGSGKINVKASSDVVVKGSKIGMN
jgi:type VI secretion system secreted protein VgrG